MHVKSKKAPRLPFGQQNLSSQKQYKSTNGHTPLEKTPLPCWMCLLKSGNRGCTVTLAAHAHRMRQLTRVREKHRKPFPGLLLITLSERYSTWSVCVCVCVCVCVYVCVCVCVVHSILASCEITQHMRSNMIKKAFC